MQAAGVNISPLTYQVSRDGPPPSTRGTWIENTAPGLFFFGVVVGVAVDLFFFRLHMFICKWVGLADWHMMAVTWKLAVDDWWLVQLNYLVKMAAHLRGFFCLADLIYLSFFIYYYTFINFLFYKYIFFFVVTCLKSFLQKIFRKIFQKLIWPLLYKIIIKIGLGKWQFSTSVQNTSNTAQLCCGFQPNIDNTRLIDLWRHNRG